MSSKMNAVRLHVQGEPAQLVYEQVTMPEPSAGEVLVCVEACGITRDELKWPANSMPVIPAHEFAGVIAGLGEGVTNLQLGDPVYALGEFDRDGAAGEFVAIKADVVAPKPRTLGFVESASIPLAALTAWQALFDYGSLEPGQRVLILGAAGAVGNFAVQLAHGYGAHVIGTVSHEGIDSARQMGADDIIDPNSAAFERIATKVDLVLDTVGGELQERSLSAMPRGSKFITITADPVKENAAEKGVMASFFVVEPNRAELIEITKLVDEGKLQTAVDEVFPLTQARAAFERSLQGRHHGKVVLSVGGLER